MKLSAGLGAFALGLGFGACGFVGEPRSSAKPVAQATKLTVRAPAHGSTAPTRRVSERGTVVRMDGE